LSGNKREKRASEQAFLTVVVGDAPFGRDEYDNAASYCPDGRND
jgi:hypothetical protein